MSRMNPRAKPRKNRPREAAGLGPGLHLVHIDLGSEQATAVRTLDGRRLITIARELTKTFETIAQMPLADATAWLDADADRTRGEFVVVVDEPPPAGAPENIPAETDRLLRALLEELPPARAARVAAQITQLAREKLYARALALRDRADEH